MKKLKSKLKAWSVKVIFKFLKWYIPDAFEESKKYRAVNPSRRLAKNLKISRKQAGHLLKNQEKLSKMKVEIKN